ncbi:MAG: hypothetical protein ACK5PS_17090 [Desulfopila sp.]
MQFQKQRLGEIFKCYSVNALQTEGATKLLFAGEGPGCGRLYCGPDYREAHTCWDGGGGTMTMVAVEDRPGLFFLSKGFYSMVDCGNSAIYLASWHNGTYTEQHVVDLPYLHRFDVITVEGRRFLLGAALHSGKKDKEDWSTPGRLVVAELPFALDGGFAVQLQEIAANIFRNHGFNRGRWHGKQAVFVSGDSGVMAVLPPQHGNSEWQIEPIFSFPVSDVAGIDLDGDGETEFALLSPFHGDRFEVLKKRAQEYRSIFNYSKPLDFYHAVYADTFNGVPSFVIGARKNDMDLFLVQYDHRAQKCVSHLIDTGVGSSNARIVHTSDGDLIMSANRQIDEAAIYRAIR